MNNTLNVIDSNLTHNSSNELQIHESKITAVEKDPFAEYIYTSSTDGTVKKININDGDISVIKTYQYECSVTSFKVYN
jgi:WD40 repeat protein